MDFHGLTRKELQTLCKKNKIPANITNVAMVDALKALETIEGIEEFLKPSESETAQSSVESPEKMEVTSPTVPRTGGRTVRRKKVSDEPETIQTVARTRRSTRKVVAGNVDEGGYSNVVVTPAVPNSRRRVPAASARRKIDTQFREIEEDQKAKENKDIPETPATMTDSRQRGLKGESMVRRTYSTRRSARLAEKNAQDLSSKAKEEFETVKSELFPKDIGEILEINVKESSDDPCEVSESAGIDLKEELEEKVNKSNSSEAVSDINFDHSVDNQTEFECDNDEESGENFEVLKSNIFVEQNEVDRYDDNPNGDIFDTLPEMTNKVLEESGYGDLYMTGSESIAEKGVEMFANQKIVCNNIASEDVEREVIDHEFYAFSSNNQTEKLREELKTDMDIGSGSSDNISRTEKVFENGKSENDTGFRNEPADDIVAQKLREEELHSDQDGGSGLSDNISPTEKVLENGKNENDSGFGNGHSDDHVANKDWDTEDIDALDINDGEPQINVSDTPEVLLPKAEEQEVNHVTASESMTVEINNSLPDESIANNLGGEPNAPKLNDSALVQSISDACFETDMRPVNDADLEVERPVPREESSRVLLEDYAEVVSNFSNDMDTLMQWDNGDKPKHGEEFECAPDEDTGIDDVLDSKKPLATPVHAADVTRDCPDSCLADEKLSSLREAELGNIILPASLTPVKRSSSKTPMKKSVSKMPNATKGMSHVSDDKENFDNSGKRLILTQEKKKNMGIGESIDYNNCSLRWLTKEFKNKLAITTNLNQNGKGNKVATSRPALQMLPENPPAGEK